MIDQAQKDNLNKIQKELDRGMYKNVRDTPIFWRKFTSIELQFILDYWRDK